MSSHDLGSVNQDICAPDASAASSASSTTGFDRLAALATGGLAFLGEATGVAAAGAAASVLAGLAAFAAFLAGGAAAGSSSAPGSVCSAPFAAGAFAPLTTAAFGFATFTGDVGGETGVCLTAALAAGLAAFGGGAGSGSSEADSESGSFSSFALPFADLALGEPASPAADPGVVALARERVVRGTGSGGRKSSGPMLGCAVSAPDGVSEGVSSCKAMETYP